MPTRNIILLIIVLAIVTALTFGFFYVRAPRTEAPGVEENPSFIATLWPFGKSDTPAPIGPGSTESPTDEPASEEELPQAALRRISSMPVAGYGVFMKERYGETAAELVPYVRYVDKATGNTYQTFADSIDERKFSVTPVPGLHEALLGRGGEAVIMRYLRVDGKSIATFAGLLPKEVLGGDTTGENELTGSFLPENISAVALSPDGSKIFYLLPSGEGVVGITADISGENKNQIFDSPFTEWSPEWPNDRMITLTTKPASGVPGYMYAIDPVTKSLNKILGGVNGLTALTSPSGKLVLYSDNSLSLKILDIDRGSVSQTGIRTLPEKCAWNQGSDSLYCAVPQFESGSGYPDTWYRGEVSFSDDIWKVDSFSGNGTLLVTPLESIDSINMKIDSAENYLFLMNKKDSFLWGLIL